ncbi:MAG: lipopolysaccharide biosynthesis protein [Thermoleophilia bacterium]|nr:lipopolysaccharide biosynthesis protein [Thermoleophilia bacterium]
MYERIKELLRHSAVYGFGTLVARVLGVLMLPLYTRYLTREDYGQIEVLIALTAVLTTVAQLGMKGAFFRFYFQSRDPAYRVRLVRTAFWFTMTSATAVLLAGLALAGEVSGLLFGTSEHANLVRASFVGLWAAMNYEQMGSLFRVEQRPVGFVTATLANVAVTVAATVVLLVVFDQGAMGVIVGSFTGTLSVYAVLLAYRRFQLGLQFDRALFRELNRFGLPLMPSGLFLWGMSFSDRFFLVKLSGEAEVGLYSIGVRLASAILLVVTAFRTAWPAFAHSIEDETEARRTYGFVMTYAVYVTCWAALALSLLAPWLLELMTTPEFYAAENVVAPLAFAGAAFAAYVVSQIGTHRAGRTRSNWLVTGAGAAVNVVLNVVLIPPFGRMGAAVATLVTYTAIFALMAWRAQRVYRVPYQWRRIAQVVAAAVAITVLGKALDVPLAVAAALALAYPLALLPLGFYLPGERRRLRLAAGRILPLVR